MAIDIVFIAVDEWNRPVFKDAYGNFYGSLDKLFDYYTCEEQILQEVKATDICYFGRTFDGDPWGGVPKEEIVIYTRAEWDKYIKKERINE